MRPVYKIQREGVTLHSSCAHIFFGKFLLQNVQVEHEEEHIDNENNEDDEDDEDDNKENGSDEDNDDEHVCDVHFLIISICYP